MITPLPALTLSPSVSKKKRHILWDTTDNVGAATCRPPKHIPLSYIGHIVDFGIRQISEHYAHITVDNYCIMPDHVHLLISIHPDENGRQIAAPTVSNVISHFKRWVSKEVGCSIWQKSFVDHIIRNDAGYEAVWKYIDNNPFALDPQDHVLVIDDISFVTH